ncbi:DUF2550 domain-containing protein [Myceligenerans xiligouense]|uniref:Uncharacterized protein DUF2550 n=1 Tax=Myceligenerans xiligouense TaxID=253184 RepID=A0A3N4YH95_9MICO|nr:DUF2550 domain-containing protein [Myceligenerans xiligouense]RPF20173.1 uncharacterized protein DUF2550 [Myceligenerans xiligouense]
MPGVVWIALAIVAAIALVLGVGASRLHTLSRRVGSFSCNARAAGQDSWTAGIAQYAVGRIEWWRCWSLSPRPARTWYRERLELVGREEFDGDGPVHYLVRCRYDGLDFELDLDSGDYFGLASWLEAAPPGRRDLVL